LADEGHPVIFYDQGGCGRSKTGPASGGVENPKKDAPWLLTIEYYVSELLALVNHLSLIESGYYLYGASWGTCLAQEFAVTQPARLLGMILDGALCDGQVYVKTQWRDRISTLPSFTQKLLK
jgi:pimeloyl-ACP methyl ester carboxylesterase